MAYGPSGFAPNMISQNVLAGRQAADQERANTQIARARDQQYEANVLGQQQQQMQLTQEQEKAFATKMVQAAQYGIQSATPKAFIEQNYPQLAQLAGDKWASATDEDVRASLQNAIGKFGPVAGIGPAEPKGASGAMYKVVDPETGDIVYESAEGARGKPAYTYTPQSSGGGPPSGYRFAAGGRLEPIPGGPADPNTPNTKDDTRIFAKADKLRDEFNAQSKDFIAVGDSYNVVKATAKDNSAAGDLSMIFAFMKMLDPTSVVRETEFANAQNAAGIPERVQNVWNKALSGERLSPAQRADFIRQAENLYKTRKTRNESLVKRYTEIAKRNRVNPDDVVGDVGVYEATAPDAGIQPAPRPAPANDGIVTVRTPQEAAALPPGTQFRTPDGRVKVRP